MTTDVVFDVESNGLLPTVTKIWCICVANLSTGERLSFGPDRIVEGLAYLSAADRLIGHNILTYDLPALKKVHGWVPRPGSVLRDTKVIARLIHPNVMETDAPLVQTGKMPAGDGYRGRHTIAAWGYRLGIPKLHEDITDWTVFTPEMAERCAGDVETNALLWQHLAADDYSQAAVELEQRIDVVTRAMEDAGVPFNIMKAADLQVELTRESARLEKQIKDQFGFWVAPEQKQPHKRVVVPKVNNAARGITKGNPYCKIKYVHFNPGSSQHIEKVLRDRGWEPEKFTATGQAEMNEQVIDQIVRKFPEMDGLGTYKMIEKRLSQLAGGEQALMKAVQEDGRIHGSINPMGTTTSRASHARPNLGQVPSSKSPYGDRFRDLFEVPSGWVLVGADQDALEGRGLGHYMAAFDSGAYAKVLLSGDPHWRSTKALGLVGQDVERDKSNRLHVITREGSKTFFYAFVYGAQGFKLGSTILNICQDAAKEGYPELLARKFGPKPPSKKRLKDIGNEAREQFIKGIPGMEKLQKIVADQVNRFNAIKGLDGRIIPVRAAHSALNFLIQSAGAILCKRWLCDAFEEMSQRWTHGWQGDFVCCLWVHDEVQIACRKGLEKEVGEILVKHAVLAGEHYKFRVPLTSSYSVGPSWAHTH